MEHSLEILRTVAQIGCQISFRPMLGEVEIFRDWLEKPGTWDRRDGSRTRRELLARYLLVNAVIDQGPDTEGVGLLLARVTNALYYQEVRFLHEPEEFFGELGIAIDQIDSVHAAVKELRAEQWAQDTQNKASRYNLFMDNARQTLSYAVFRWGVPLAVPLVLDRESTEEQRPSVLLGYLRGYSSAEVMSKRLKDHPRYGLGKAIGDKAAHLYAKWLVHTFPILQKPQTPGWGPFSFEAPFDSNAGRVLWRTGFFLEWATLEEYIDWKVIQPGEGQAGTDYIRVTNIREKKSQRARDLPVLWQAYRNLVSDHLCVVQRPRKIEIQRIPLALLLLDGSGAPGELDDGLMHIGTTYCFNHSEPHCQECPLRDICQGHLSDRDLITNYSTS